MTGREGWPTLSAFCLFVGYGRSGHSAVGSVIDAHPCAAISHELHAVRLFLDGMSREALLREVFLTAQRQAMAGRRSSRAEGGTYLHRIDGQLKADTAGLTVLGDKKGAGTTTLVRERGLDLLTRFEAFVSLPLSIVHVVRNPYDMIAAGLARGRTTFLDLVPTVAAVRQCWPADRWLDVYYEDVIAQPREQVARILTFLSLPLIDAHLDRCEQYLYSTVNRRRFGATWPARLRADADEAIARYDFLSRYSWND